MNVGEYPSQTAAQCCGDDIREVYSGGTDETYACCDGRDGHGRRLDGPECVIDGVCRDRTVATEICDDNIDNDCDGIVDEITNEICYDNADNDCDGSIDEITDEICEDDTDNDCDGFVDEWCGGCAESDDGRDYYDSGTTIGLSISGVEYETTERADYCVNSNTLQEFYCDGNFVEGEEVDCHYGCLDGACTKGKVILLSWDGTQRNHLAELLAAGKLPNLQRLIDEGQMRDMVIFTEDCRCANDGDNYHTLTGPAHAAMLTGYGFPETMNHANRSKGVGGAPGEYEFNDCPEYCPEGSPVECFGQLGPNPIPKGYTIFERLKEFDPIIKTALITGKDHQFFPFPAFTHAAPASCHSQFCVFGDGNAIDTCYPTTDDSEYVTPRLLAFIEENQHSPFFLFGHYGGPDVEGHIYGENSPEYTNSIISDDVGTGEIVRKLKDLGIYEDTIIMVTTDHGFVENRYGHHSCQSSTKNVWIVSNRRRVIDNQDAIAKQTSIVPTIFDIFGIDKDVSPPFAGQSLLVP